MWLNVSVPGMGRIAEILDYLLKSNHWQGVNPPQAFRTASVLGMLLKHNMSGSVCSRTLSHSSWRQACSYVRGEGGGNSLHTTHSRTSHGGPLTCSSGYQGNRDFILHSYFILVLIKPLPDLFSDVYGGIIIILEYGNVMMHYEFPPLGALCLV